MSSFEREFRLIVFFKREITWGESVNAVTFIAIGHHTIHSKFSFMIIRVAVHTTIVFKRSSQTYFMARFTGNKFVFPNKFKGSFIVVEIA